MPIDGALLRYIKNEIKDKAVGCRVEKVYQPSKYEIIICLRSVGGNHKLLISSSSNSARLHFTKYDIPNPQSPPMFCMLLRKKLCMAKLINVRQEGLERALYLDFSAKNELGDDTKVTVAVEIMGKYSNIIIIENDIIVDAIKRVNSEMSSKRLILPKIKYENPPKQNKLCIFDVDVGTLDTILNYNSDMELYKIINLNFQGISSLLVKRLLAKLFNNPNIRRNETNGKDMLILRDELLTLFDIIKNINGSPAEILYENRSDVSFIAYKNERIKEYKMFSDLIDTVYFEEDRNERINSKTGNLIKHLKTITLRLQNKIKQQQEEISMCDKKDIYKLYGDLIMSNLHLIGNGKSSIELQNYYEEDGRSITIKLKPSINASKNAQLYYKKYKKACSAEKFLRNQISKSKVDIEYLDGVIDFLSRAESEQELYEIQKELEENKYIKKIKDKNKIKAKPLKPLEYISKDGFKILVGRNSKQNDNLTMKIACKNDIWFHVKDMHGAHVILVLDGKTASEEAINMCANLSALNSKARYSSNVAVDYTEARNVKKPSGSKPGMVNYVNYKTIYITPEKIID